MLLCAFVMSSALVHLVGSSPVRKVPSFHFTKYCSCGAMAPVSLLLTLIFLLSRTASISWTFLQLPTFFAGYVSTMPSTVVSHSFGTANIVPATIISLSSMMPVLQYSWFSSRNAFLSIFHSLASLLNCRLLRTSDPRTSLCTLASSSLSSRCSCCIWDSGATCVAFDCTVFGSISSSSSIPCVCCESACFLSPTLSCIWIISLSVVMNSSVSLMKPSNS